MSIAISLKMSNQTALKIRTRFAKRYVDGRDWYDLELSPAHRTVADLRKHNVSAYKGLRRLMLRCGATPNVWLYSYRLKGVVQGHGTTALLLQLLDVLIAEGVSDMTPAEKELQQHYMECALAERFDLLTAQNCLEKRLKHAESRYRPCPENWTGTMRKIAA